MSGEKRLQRHVTVSEAAHLAGVSTRAIEARVERGTLPSVKRGRRRYIAVEDLYATGLIRLEAGKTVGEMLDRIEALARRVGELEAELRQREEGGRGARAPRP